jgi:hypothetical protein
MAPTPTSLASDITFNSKDFEWSGKAKTGAVVRALLMASKAVSSFSPQVQGCLELVNDVRGEAMML